jgi:hypoxanthine-DNA glycosylase
MAVLHGLAPLLRHDTRVVVLGSFPGVRSLQTQQYYGHKNNQFWRLIFSVIYASDAYKYCSSSYEINSINLLDHGVGLWDVYAACEREGSLDSAIQHAQLNDLASLRTRCPQLQAIAHNGGESFKHAKHTTRLGLPVFKLPSSSPANASWSFERKLEVWQASLEKYLV